MWQLPNAKYFSKYLRELDGLDTLIILNLQMRCGGKVIKHYFPKAIQCKYLNSDSLQNLPSAIKVYTSAYTG